MSARMLPRTVALSSVYRVMGSAMITGRPTSRRVAGELNMSPRTLHRRLREVGTSFSEVRDRCRLRLARQLLLASDARMHEIATAAGYRDPSSFSRAFLRWTGQTPRQFRAAGRID